MVKKRKTIEYSNAVCATREKTLVTKSALLRMAEAENLATAFDILRESSFGGQNKYKCEEFEKLIEDEQRSIVEFVKEYAPNRETEEFCLYSYDFYNAQVILKSEYLRLNYENYIQTEGLISIQDLLLFIRDGADINAPKELKSAVDYCKKGIKEGLGGAQIGAYFARCEYACLKRIAKSAYLKDIIVKKIDGLNLCTCLRCNSYDNAKEQIIQGGTLTDGQLEVICLKNSEKIEVSLKDHYLKSMAISALNQVLKGKPLVDTEREINGFANRRMMQNQYVEQSGTMPFMRYIFARQNAVSCVRTALTGKLNGLDSEQIKRRLTVV